MSKNDFRKTSLLAMFRPRNLSIISIFLGVPPLAVAVVTSRLLSCEMANGTEGHYVGLFIDQAVSQHLYFILYCKKADLNTVVRR